MSSRATTSLADAARAVASGGRITVLTGAGISAESGLRTFRDAGGLWENHPIEEVATPEGFARNPELVQRFYNLRRKGVLEALPNAAHRALVDLEARLGERFTLITQNVDDLHERAGSRRLLHMHGEILKARCTRCGRVLAWTKDIASSDRCPGCSSGLRPHVVWFGEMPLYMEDEIPAALAAEVFVSIGTSGVVYPAAGFVSEARAHGALTVEINLEPSGGPGAWEPGLPRRPGRIFDLSLIGKATERVPDLVRGVLGD